MKKIKINLRNLGDTESVIKVPIGNISQPVDTSEAAENKFVEDEVAAAINPIQDFEKMRFIPASGVTEIIIRLKDSGSTDLNYDTFGYSNGDVLFRRNRFVNSFLKLDFYDSPSPTNRRLAFQLIIFNQLNKDQRNGTSLKDISNMPITYRLVDPIRVRRGVSEGFYLYWLKEPTEAYPNNFYMYATYNNANDGKVTQLVAYDAPVPINLYNSINWTKYQLASVGSLQEYFVDNTDRTITFSGNKMIINLYLADLI